LKQEPALKKRYLLKLASNIVNGLINVILVAIVPKALGTVAYGEFSYLFQFFARAIGFFDSGSSTAFFTKLSADSKRRNLIGYYFILSGIILLLSTLLIFLSSIFNFNSQLFPDIDEQYIYLGFLFGFLTWFMNIFIKISDSYALTVSVEIVKIGYKTLSAIVLVILINWFYFDLTIYLLFQTISISIFLFVVSILFIQKSIFSKAIWQNIEFIRLSKEFFQYIAPLFVSNTIGLAIGFFQIWLLQKYGGSEESGFYGLAYQIAAMSFLFTSAMTQIITREFSKSFGENNIPEIRRLFLKYVPMLYSVSGFFSLFILFQAENLLIIFTDENFLKATSVVMIMSFYPIHQTYGQLSSSLYFATERTKLYRNTSLIGQFISLILSIFLLYIFQFGAVGFAIMMVVSQFLNTNLQLYYNSRYLNISFLKLLLHQIYSVAVFLSLSFSASTTVNFSNPIFSFLISGVIYLILSGVAIYIYPGILSLKREEIRRFWRKRDS